MRSISRVVSTFGVRCAVALAVALSLTASSASAAEPCPGAVRFDIPGASSDIDPGWTGIEHDGHYVGLTLTMGITGCAGSQQPTCGACSLTGPLANGGGATFNNRRCVDQTWLTCVTNGDCVSQGAAGPCEIFFGPPLPYSGGGVSVCVTNEITAAGSGSIGVESGDATMNLPYKATIYSGLLLNQPCPVCNSGSCVGGPRNGMACTTNGTSPLFGNVSFDCPPSPGGSIGSLVPSGLTLSTTPQQKTLSAASPNCRATGWTSKKCFCDTCNSGTTPTACSMNADCPDPPGPIGPICGGKRCAGGANAGAACTANSECPGGACSVPGFPTASNQCDDAVCSSNPGDTDSPNEGQCAGGPLEDFCSAEPYRGCLMDSDCAPTGGTCTIHKFRECFTDNGNPGNSITAGGVADPPVDNGAAPTLGAVECIPSSVSASVNAASGFPGPGRLTLPSLLTLADEIADGKVGAGGTVTTDTEADGATPSDPLETTVTTPNAGEIILEEQAATGTPPGGFTFLGKQVNITAPNASAASPLVIVFRIDASRIPAGENEQTVAVFKNGVSVPNCTGAGATPDPCVATRTLLGDGDVQLTIHTSTASRWNFGTQEELCPPAPDPGCNLPFVPNKSTILLKDDPDDAKDILVWKWLKGSQTLVGDFGDPTSSTAYELCIYDNSGLLGTAHVPAGGTCDGKPCWAAKPGLYKYKDKLLANSGISQIQLKAAVDGKAKILVKGKGVNLPMPNLSSIVLPLSLEIHNADSNCWRARYQSLVTNDGLKLKGKSDN